MKIKYLLVAFAITAIAQVAIPGKMIYESEMTERYGTVYKFRTEPIDPSDPFRGKYISLDYELSELASQDTTWIYESDVYVRVANDSLGFAKAKSVFHQAPEEGDYFKATVRNHIEGTLYVDIPFDLYYMEEGKAYEAEKAYQEYSSDNLKPAYALVALKGGNAVVKDVIIDGKPVRDYVLERRETKQVTP